LSVLFFVPLLFAIVTSLKSPDEIYVIPIKWIPRELMWSNYSNALSEVPFARFFANTVIITLLAIVGQMLSASLVGYGFARFAFPGRDLLFLLVLGLLILPVEVTLVPTFLLFKAVGWLDTWLPLIVPAYFGGGPFAIFVFRQFFRSIPRDLDEAAEIDGAGSLRIFLQIVAPLSLPAFATIGIFGFLSHWNDFLGPLIFLTSVENFTISLGLRFYQQVALSSAASGAPREHYLMAASLLASLPIVLVFLGLQKYFVRGIIMSGIKG
jgi:ABC-type glycerol-3-phosphate transport system permease component